MNVSSSLNSILRSLNMNLNCRLVWFGDRKIQKQRCEFIQLVASLSQEVSVAFVLELFAARSMQRDVVASSPRRAELHAHVVLWQPRLSDVLRALFLELSKDR